jgi:hypothetical protein
MRSDDWQLADGAMSADNLQYRLDDRNDGTEKEG